MSSGLKITLALTPVAATIIAGRALGLPWRDIPYLIPALALEAWAHSERRKADQ